MSETELPPCGLYRTTAPIGEVPAGRLVYFHNHGEPGPGVYLPSAWTHNRAAFHSRGTTLPSNTLAATLDPLVREGLYVVERELVCCEKRCQTFAADSLVQLGYNGEGRALLFLPRLAPSGVVLPERGTAIDDDRLASLRFLQVAVDRGEKPDVVH